MVQRVKVLAANSDDLSFIPGTYSKLSSDFYIYVMTYMGISVNKKNE